MNEDKEKVTVERQSGSRNFSEEMEVAGSQLVDKVQEAIHQGNVRKLVIRSVEGKVLLETSLTIAGGVGIVAMILNPPLAVMVAVVAAIAGAMMRVKVEIVREVTDDNPVVTGAKKSTGRKKKVEIEDE